MRDRKWTRAQHIAQMCNVLVPHVVSVQSIRRNVLAAELRKRGVQYRKSHIAAAAWLMDSHDSPMLQWRALLRYTELQDHELNEALLIAKVMR